MQKKIFLMSLLSSVHCLTFAYDFNKRTAENLKQNIITYDNFNEEKKASVRDRLASNGWVNLINSKENEIYLNYNYSTSTGRNQIRMWSREVVKKDTKKDGLSVGDYTMTLTAHNCIDNNFQILTLTKYKHTNKAVISHQEFSPYIQPFNVIPESVGESLHAYACYFNHLKNN